MEYEKKVKFLLIVIGVLSLILTASHIFTPERAGARSASFVWLDSRFADRITNIVMIEGGETRELVWRSNQWFVLHEGREFPARQLRVEDFISTFTTRADWPVRSSSAASHERLGVGSDPLARVIFYGENVTFLDVLFGYTDNTGREVFLRRNNQNEVRQGSNIPFSYTRSHVTSWFNLRLIPESEDGAIGLDNVQRLSVYTPEETQIFSRINRLWHVSGIDIENPSQIRIDNYVRAILNTLGEDFDLNVSIFDPLFDHSRIVLELDNGRTITIRITDEDEDGNRLANVAGTEFVYLIAPWSASRLFMDASDFEML